MLASLFANINPEFNMVGPYREINQKLILAISTLHVVPQQPKCRIGDNNLKPLSAKYDFSRFKIFLLPDKITVIGNEMSVETSRCGNFWSQIEQINLIFTHLNLKWVKIVGSIPLSILKLRFS